MRLRSLVASTALAASLLLNASACRKQPEQPPLPDTDGSEQRSLKLTSKAFADGATIPAPYTCDGANVSPPLQWNAAPAAAKSLALVVDDPDAPGGTYTHWLVYNLPLDAKELNEATTALTTLPGNAQQGSNDFGNAGYGGPCPPPGDAPHRYHFTLYALNTTLDLPANPKRDQIRRAMLGHIIDQGELTGRYQRAKR